jgi:hypothetical protein
MVCKTYLGSKESKGSKLTLSVWRLPCPFVVLLFGQQPAPRPPTPCPGNHNSLRQLSGALACVTRLIPHRLRAQEANVRAFSPSTAAGRLWCQSWKSRCCQLAHPVGRRRHPEDSFTWTRTREVVSLLRMMTQRACATSFLSCPRHS